MTVPKKICGHVAPAQVLVKKMREIVTMIPIAMAILNVAKTIVLDPIFMLLLIVATNHLQVRKFKNNVLLITSRLFYVQIFSMSEVEELWVPVQLQISLQYTNYTN